MRKEHMNMSVLRNSIFAFIIICIFIKPVYAGTRNIYIGDPITFEIKSQTLTEEELKKALDVFEIIDLKDVDTGYQVTIKSFDTGEKSVDIEKNEIIVMIASMLDEVNRDDIYEVNFAGEELTDNKAIRKNIFICFYIILILAFITSGIILLINKVKHRNKKSKSSYIIFKESLDKLDIDEETYLENMTLLLKRYLEAVYGYKIIGKTSREIIEQIQWNEKNIYYKKYIENWLIKCDQYKFSGFEVELTQKEQLRDDLYKLTDIIHGREEVTS